jgi:hypothetical protein
MIRRTTGIGRMRVVSERKRSFRQRPYADTPTRPYAGTFLLRDDSAALRCSTIENDSEDENEHDDPENNGHRSDESRQ